MYYGNGFQKSAISLQNFLFKIRSAAFQFKVESLNPTIFNIIQWDYELTELIVPPSDGPMFILIDWEKFSETVAQ